MRNECNRDLAVIAQDLSRHTDRMKQPRWDFQLFKQIECPIAALHIETLGCGRVALFVGWDTTQPVGQQIGDGQQPRGSIQRRIVGIDQADQLKERVDRHNLNPGPSEDFGARHTLENTIGQAIGAGIAVMNGVADQLPSVVNQRKIDTPGVNADRVDWLIGAGLADPVLYIVPQAQHIPIQRAAHPCRDIGKAVNFLCVQPRSVKCDSQHPATFRAEVYGQYPFTCHDEAPLAGTAAS